MLAAHRVVPAVVIEDAKNAAALGRAMVAGGMPVVEVTLRTPEALKALQVLSGLPGMIAGAGTVTSLSQLNAALRAGARFIVTPGLEETVIRHCHRREIPIIPGAVTPTEILAARNLGVNLVKFFPAHAFGGLPTIDALSGPFPDMKFLPTGGITLENLQAFLKHPSVFACGGTWMARREWIAKGSWSEIEKACAKTVKLVAGLK